MRSGASSIGSRRLAADPEDHFQLSLIKFSELSHDKNS
jgi:hypothetical protein